MSRSVKIFVKIRPAVVADFYWVTFEGARKLKVGYQYYELNPNGGYFFCMIPPIKSAAEKVKYFEELTKKIEKEELWVADPFLKNEELQERELTTN